MRAQLDVQLQQSLLVPHMNFDFEVVEQSTGRVHSRFSERVQHNGAGEISLVQIEPLALDAGREYSLRVIGKDSSGSNNLPELLLPIKR